LVWFSVGLDNRFLIGLDWFGFQLDWIIGFFLDWIGFGFQLDWIIGFFGLDWFGFQLDWIWFFSKIFSAYC
jgi:hypothetical protein